LGPNSDPLQVGPCGGLGYKFNVGFNLVWFLV